MKPLEAASPTAVDFEMRPLDDSLQAVDIGDDALMRMVKHTKTTTTTPLSKLPPDSHQASLGRGGASAGGLRHSTPALKLKTENKQQVTVILEMWWTPYSFHVEGLFNTNLLSGQ